MLPNSPANPTYSRRVFRRLTRPFQGLTLATLLGSLFSFGLGLLTNIWLVPILIIWAIFFAILLIAILYHAFRAEMSREVTQDFQGLLEPDNHALSAVAAENKNFLVVGQAIEIIPHPSLRTRASIDEMGWDPSAVILNDLQIGFSAAGLLAEVGGYREFDPPNGIKYALADTSFNTVDSPVLRLDFSRTNYFTIKSVLPAIKEDPSLRARYLRLDPTLHQIPNSLSLHYIVRFADGRVLCMKRDRRAAYHPSLWSFSGEEQLSEVDFNSEEPCASLFKRAFCEEVLALRYNAPLTERWRIAQTMIRQMRLWSVFMEEGIGNYSVLGLFQTHSDTIESASEIQRILTTHLGSRDPEGELFTATTEMVQSLIRTGSCIAQSFFGDTSETIQSADLHPTSRYRIIRLLHAVSGPIDL